MKLIDKDALVAEIERLYKKHSGKYGCDEAGLCLNVLEGFIDTLEVKVDLEKEISEYFVEHSDEFFSDKYKLVAKHFFELGMAVSNKAQKGE